MALVRLLVFNRKEWCLRDSAARSPVWFVFGDALCLLMQKITVLARRLQYHAAGVLQVKVGVVALHLTASGGAKLLAASMQIGGE